MGVYEPKREVSDRRVCNLRESLNRRKPNTFLVHLHQAQQYLDIQGEASPREYPQMGKLIFRVARCHQSMRGSLYFHIACSLTPTGDPSKHHLPQVRLQLLIGDVNTRARLAEPSVFAGFSLQSICFNARI